MKDFKIIESKLLKNTPKYKLISEGIYLDLDDNRGYATHRLAMEMTLEEGDSDQYPLEDLLDKYYVHVADFLERENPQKPRYIFGGDLKDLQNFKSIIGKRAYNEEFVDGEGQTLIKLIVK